MKNKNLLKIALLLIIFNIIAFSAYADSNIKLEAKPSKLSVKAGETFDIQLSMKFKGDWYGYSLEEQLSADGIGPLPTELTVLPADLIKLSGKIKALDEHSKFDKGFQMNVKYFKGSARFILPVKALKSITFGKQKITINANMQLCQGTSCQPADNYKTIVLNEIYTPDESVKNNTDATSATKSCCDSTTNKVSDGSSSATVSKVSGNKKIDENAEGNKPVIKEESQSIWTVIWLGMLSGALAILTPCVYPMVPITVSFFTKRAEKSKGKGLRDALAYAIGIILTFTGIGFFFSMIFGPAAFQNFASSAWVNLFIVLICVVFGLSLFGAFEIQMPTGIINKLNAKSMKGSGLSSVFLMGLTFSLASFACTGPLVAAALISAFKGQWFLPIVSMVSFSTVLAFPFFLLALFPSLLSSMPQSGGWMNNIKVVLAFILIAISFKFLNSALLEWNMHINREIFISIWIGCSFLITIYLLGLFKTEMDAPVDRVSTTRMVFVIVFATLTFWLMSALNGKPMGILEAYLPSPDVEVSATANVGTGATQETPWLENYQEALQKAKATGQNVFVDFTGVHCTNCHYLERTIFTKPEVQSLINKMVKVKLITDQDNEPYKSNKELQMKKFNSVGLPLYVIITPDEKIIAKKEYTTDINEFTDFLKKGIK